MIINPLRRALLSGPAPLGTIIFSGNSHITELSAYMGFDFVVIDTEHTLNHPENLLSQVRAVQAQGACIPVVRTPGHDPDMIKGMLDAVGVENLMFPFVQHVDEAKALVDACTYPPRGIRGYAGTTRATHFGTIRNYAATADDRLCLIAQIESQKAMEHILEIGQVPGIHALFIGLGDLAQEMGVSRGMADPDFKDYVGDAVERCAAHGIAVGSFQFSIEGARFFLEKGGRFVSLGSDLRFVADGAQQALQALRSDVYLSK